MLISWLACGQVAGQGAACAAEDNTLGRPGYLIIQAVRDSSAGFRWEDAAGQRRLIWDQGRLIVSDSLEIETCSRFDIGFACTAELVGSGDSGDLILRDGIYPVSEPLVLTDNRFELQVTGGELEIRGARIIYRQVAAESGEFRSGMLLLAGMTLLVVVLLRRARLKSSEGTGH